MHPVSFVADSAAEAVAKIRSELGPDAVVLHVRKLPAAGLSRLWHRPRIEVLAHKPESAAPSSAAPASAASHAVHETILEIRQELADMKRQFGNEARVGRFLDTREPDVVTIEPFADTFDRFEGRAALIPEPAARPVTAAPGEWRLGGLLERTGLLPTLAQRVVDDLVLRHGPRPPEQLADELALGQAWLRQWRPRPKSGPAEATRRHVMIGPSGSGKTTALCKWVTQSALVEGVPVEVWRLDGATANTAEALSVYCEILGVPMHRTLDETASRAGEVLSFVDLPGVPWQNPAAVRELGEFLGRLGPAEVHLVLNAGYESSLLMAQVRSFSSLPITDLIVTHLDEEGRWGKLWNLLLGTNYSIRYLSAGQNVPGEFLPARAETILARQFS